MSYGNGPNHVEAPEIAAERDRLHDACGEAYEKAGTINCAAWRKASNELNKFRAIHGYEYNPD